MVTSTPLCSQSDCSEASDVRVQFQYPEDREINYTGADRLLIRTVCFSCFERWYLREYVHKEDLIWTITTVLSAHLYPIKDVNYE